MKNLLALALLAFVLGCGSSTASPFVNRPRPQVGEQWMFDYGFSVYTGTCVAIRDDEFLFSIDEPFKTMRTAKLKDCWKKVEPGDTVASVFAEKP